MSRPTFWASITSAALVHGATDDLGADLLRDRHGLAGDHRLVDGAAALEHGAVDRHLLAGADAEPVADLDSVELDLLLGSVGPGTPRRLGREIEKRPDGAARALPRTQLEHLPEQDENRNHRRRFEVDRHRSAGASERRREDARREGRDHAVDPGHARAHCDEREHVQAAVHDRLPAAHEQRPARPQHDRSAEEELEPVRRLRPEHLVEPGHVPAHLERKHGQGEHRPDPEAAREVGELGIWPGCRP